MKKNVKTIMGGFLSVALLAGFISCSNGTSDETNQAAQGLNLAGASSTSGTAIAAEDIFSGEKITFKITDASTTAEDTVFVIKYDRSAKGAAEKITLNDVNVEVTVNGEAVSIGNKIDFELDPYSSFNPSYNYSSPESANDQHEYKAKPVINKKLGKDDTVTIEVKSAKVSGEGKGKVDLGKITVAVVDINKAVNYYKEVAVSGEKAEKYIPLITKKNGKGLNEVETPTPANNTPENPAPTITWSESILASLDKEDKIVSGENKGVWESGTHITGDSAPYTVTHGTGWDASGMATMPVNTGSLEGFNYLLVDIDSSKFTFRDGSEQYPSFEVKVEFTDGNGDAVIINGTKCAVEGIYYIPLTKVSNVSVIKNVTFNLRGTGTLTLKDIKKAKDN